MHRALNLAQPMHQARTGKPRRARAWPYRGSPSAVSQLGPAVPWPGPAISQHARVRPCVLCRAVSQLYRRTQAAVSWPSAAHLAWSCRGLGCALYRNTMPSLQQLSVHNTTECIAIQNPLIQAPAVMIQKLYHDTAYQPTNLQYNNCIAIQSSVLLAASVTIQKLYRDTTPLPG